MPAKAIATVLPTQGCTDYLVPVDFYHDPLLLALCTLFTDEITLCPEKLFTLCPDELTLGLDKELCVGDFVVLSASLATESNFVHQFLRCSFKGAVEITKPFLSFRSINIFHRSVQVSASLCRSVPLNLGSVAVVPVTFVPFHILLISIESIG